jgi:hypothetical protein
VKGNITLEKIQLEKKMPISCEAGIILEDKDVIVPTMEHNDNRLLKIKELHNETAGNAS